MITRTMHTLPDPTLSRVSALLAEQMGLDFPSERWADLERGMRAAAHELGEANLEACARHILSGPLTHRQTEILAGHLTVGETYFFRDRASFDALEQSVLPELIRSRRNAGRFLRIWSAGCCSGEEPYSIAMLLDRILPADEQWHITLLATDINPQFLRKAMTGIYTDWSFRGMPFWIRDRYFTKRSRGRFELHPRIRQMVTFSYLNLAEDAYPSLTSNTNAMDLIFCRNVLMYFTEAHMSKVIGNLHRALADGGALSVSPSEASGRLFAQFAPVNFRDTVFYRKSAGDNVRAEWPETAYPSDLDTMPVDAGVMPGFAPELEEVPAVQATVSEAPRMEMPEEKLAVSAANAAADADDSAAELYARAKLCANQGLLDEAADWCEQAVAKDKLDPQKHYLLATIRRELGQDDAAESSLKRALYLDPGFALASFSFGNLCLSQGRYKEAARHFGNALTLLQRRDPLDVISEADGLLAGRLCEIITSVLDSLPRSRREEGRAGMSYEDLRVNHA